LFGADTSTVTPSKTPTKIVEKSTQGWRIDSNHSSNIQRLKTPSNLKNQRNRSQIFTHETSTKADTDINDTLKKPVKCIYDSFRKKLNINLNHMSDTKDLNTSQHSSRSMHRSQSNGNKATSGNNFNKVQHFENGALSSNKKKNAHYNNSSASTNRLENNAKKTLSVAISQRDMVKSDSSNILNHEQIDRNRYIYNQTRLNKNDDQMQQKFLDRSVKVINKKYKENSVKFIPNEVIDINEQSVLASQNTKTKLDTSVKDQIKSKLNNYENRLSRTKMDNYNNIFGGLSKLNDESSRIQERQIKQKAVLE